MIINIPFSGFYDSIHTHNLNDTIESDISELSETDQATIFNDFQYTNAMLVDYSKLYISSLLKELEGEHGIKIKLSFESLESPKEYNFSTDRIFCNISEEDTAILWALADKVELKRRVKEKFTSYDGFISHYPNDLNEWDDNPLNWDYNQLGLLIELLLSEDFELYSMDDSNSDGSMTDVIYKGLSEKIIKIINDFYK